MALETIKQFIRLMKRIDGTRISRSGMPNGFLLKNLVWFGDAATPRTAIARGFFIEPNEIDSLDLEFKDDLVDRLRQLIRLCGDEYTIQVRKVVGSDYRAHLANYKADTEAIEDKHRFRWQIWNRTERHARYEQAMREGKLRRETLSIFFSRVIESQPSFSVSEDALGRHFEKLAEQEAAGFEAVQGEALNTLFPDCRVRAMTDEDHYRQYWSFLNPSRPHQDDNFEWWNSDLSIQENCLGGDIVQPNTPGISFQLDAMNHVVLVMTELPKLAGEGMITRLTNLGFQDFEIVVNVYPRRSEDVLKKMEYSADHLKGEAATNQRRERRLSTEAELGDERVMELTKGHVTPFDVFFAIRIWHKDAETLISQASIAKHAFTRMSSATCHHATHPETARQLWFNTWPGWTFSDYRGYDLTTDDWTAADMLPWSSSFTGRLDRAEALYDSPSGALVGLSTQVNGVPQMVVIFAQSSAGKSIVITDLYAQIGHNFDYTLIVEEGLSHGTTAQTAGAEPIVIMPDSGITINYLDVDGIPLTREHLGSAVALNLQMLRENVGVVDQARVSLIQAILTKHLNLLFDSSWTDWSRKNPEKTQEIEINAYQIAQHLKQMTGHGNTFLDAWSEWRERDPGDDVAPDAMEVAKFATHHSTKGIVRDLGLSYMAPEEQPTHSELVELLTLTPIGGFEDNQETVRIGERLSAWKSDGSYGKLFDGVTNTHLNGNFTHFELGLIDNAKEELKAAAHFLVLNISRKQVIKRPRAERKLVVFEEGARLISLPGGAQAMKEFFAQLRKFGAVVCASFQQVSALTQADPTLRSAVLDNAKLFLISSQPSPDAAREIAEVLGLSQWAEQSIRHYVSPEHQTGQKFSSFLMVAPDARRRLIGTFRNIASKEVVYCGASDNETFDNRSKDLAKYEDVVTGILTEARR